MEDRSVALRKRSIPQISADTLILVDRLRPTKIGELVAYEDLSRAIARDVQGEARGLLQTARRILLNDERMVFDAVVGQGLQRASDLDIVAGGERGIRLIGARARREQKKLACVQEFERLPEDKKTSHNAAFSMLGALSAVTKRGAVSRLKAAVEKACSRLSLDTTLSVVATPAQQKERPPIAGTGQRIDTPIPGHNPSRGDETP